MIDVHVLVNLYYMFYEGAAIRYVICNPAKNMYKFYSYDLIL